MEIFKFIQIFIIKNVLLRVFYIKFLDFIFKKIYKNKFKVTKFILNFFINLKIYLKLKGVKICSTYIQNKKKQR